MQFEADIQSLQRSLENSKANHVNMQKMYNSQCGKSMIIHSMILADTIADEAQRLRDLLRDRDEEIKDFEHAAQVHGAADEKVSLLPCCQLERRID
jgi:hypothetical protein